MKISWNWLKDYIDPGLTPEEVSGLLTGCGLEVEEMEDYCPVKGGLEGVVIGEVLTCERHPDSDHLSLTTVNAGKGEPLPIVCGAPNVAAGQKVAVATVGTTLWFGDKEIVIKKAKIRGAVSEGMICAEDELGLGSSHAGIMVLDPSAVPGTPAADYFRIEKDVVFGIGLTPNRVDAASHTGVARDLAALIPGKSMNLPDVGDFTVESQTGTMEIVIDDPEACPRYTGLTIQGVKVGESPAWLKNRLGAIGLRPINNIVDITNYILHELGQPLHAFDADEITGNKVVIRKQYGGTKFVTLDGVERELTAGDLMISNSEAPMCIAGVFGGVRSGVTEKTQNVFLESAYFNPKSVRMTARHHGLQTDASFRFERGANYDITVYAIKRAALLIKEIAGGTIASEIVDVYPKPINPLTVRLSWAGMDRLTGTPIPQETAKQILVALGFVITAEDAGGIDLRVPPYKVDVTREADVIEEVLRIFGYNKVGFSAGIKSTVSYTTKPDREKLQNRVADYLSSNGFFEIMNNSLTRSAYYEQGFGFSPEQTAKVFNPLSRDLDAMRQSLLFGGLESIAYNQNRKIFTLKLYEFGTVYSAENGKTGLDKYREGKHLAIFLTGNKTPENWNAPVSPVDFYDLKGYLMVLLARIGLDLRKIVAEPVSGGIWKEALVFRTGGHDIVTFGSLSPELLEKFDCRQEVFHADIDWYRLCSVLPVTDPQFTEIPRFPEVRRDLALLVDRSVTFDAIRDLAFRTEKKVLRQVGLFDVYEGENLGKDKKSYAVSFILQDLNKTLTDKEIDKIMQSLIHAFSSELYAVIR
jgi:phenylalanyl-tRNA synthetase beta chain